MLKMDKIIGVLTFSHVTKPQKVPGNRELWVHELVVGHEREGDFNILLPHLEKNPKNSSIIFE